MTPTEPTAPRRHPHPHPHDAIGAPDAAGREDDLPADPLLDALLASPLLAPPPDFTARVMAALPPLPVVATVQATQATQAARTAQTARTVPATRIAHTSAPVAARPRPRAWPAALWRALRALALAGGAAAALAEVGSFVTAAFSLATVAL